MVEGLHGGAAERSSGPGVGQADREAESLRVRLSWPHPAGAPDEPAVDDPADDARSEDDDRAGEPLPPPEVVTMQSFRNGADVGPAVGLLIDAYERLGSRLLSRLRDLRTDVDGDLAAVRSELASLRTAVEDVADRVQLRQMRSSIDELRSDVAGLRRAVLEWPELERVSTDLSALRAATSELQEQVARLPVGLPAADPAGVPEELAAQLEALDRAVAAIPAPPAPTEIAAVVRAELEARPAPEVPRPDLAALAPLVEELGELRSEMEALRRRIALRASTEGSSLGSRDVEAIAQAVAARMRDAAQPR